MLAGSRCFSHHLSASGTFPVHSCGKRSRWQRSVCSERAGLLGVDAVILTQLSGVQGSQVSLCPRPP